jgi:hypothetical protein
MALFPPRHTFGWGNQIEALLTDLYERGEPLPPGERLCIYYGIPQNVNSLFDPEQAAALFSRWDLVVFGQPMQDPNNVDHAGAVETIARIRAMNPRAVVFGYVSLAEANGVSAPLTDQQVRDQIDAWQATGVTGMLLDEYGFDYEVPRSRQNMAVDYTHDLGMRVLVNVWNQVDAFAVTAAEALEVDPFRGDTTALWNEFNPANTASTIAAGDYTLLETWIVNTDFAAYDPNGVAGVFNIRHRARHARYFRDLLGVKWLGASVVNYGDTTTEQQQGFFDLTEAFARICGADGWGVDALNYSASLPVGNLGVVKAWNFDRSPLPKTPDYHVTGDSLTLTRQDLRLRLTGTDVNPGLSTWTITDLGV